MLCLAQVNDLSDLFNRLSSTENLSSQQAEIVDLIELELSAIKNSLIIEAEIAIRKLKGESQYQVTEKKLNQRISWLQKLNNKLTAKYFLLKEINAELLARNKELEPSSKIKKLQITNDLLSYQLQNVKRQNQELKKPTGEVLGDSAILGSPQLKRLSSGTSQIKKSVLFGW